jgi:hypothetical protein
MIDSCHSLLGCDAGYNRFRGPCCIHPQGEKEFSFYILSELQKTRTVIKMEDSRLGGGNHCSFTCGIYIATLFKHFYISCKVVPHLIKQNAMKVY